MNAEVRLPRRILPSASASSFAHRAAAKDLQQRGLGPDDVARRAARSRQAANRAEAAVVGSLDAEQLVTVASLTAPVKRRMVKLLAARRGHRILDIGCGPGLDTLTLGKAVGPTGLVVGVDHDPRMIDAATDRARR